METGTIIAIVVVALLGPIGYDIFYGYAGSFFKRLAEEKLAEDSTLRKILLFKIRQ